MDTDPATLRATDVRSRTDTIVELSGAYHLAP